MKLSLAKRVYGSESAPNGYKNERELGIRGELGPRSCITLGTQYECATLHRLMKVPVKRAARRGVKVELK